MQRISLTPWPLTPQGLRSLFSFPLTSWVLGSTQLERGSLVFRVLKLLFKTTISLAIWNHREDNHGILSTNSSDFLIQKLLTYILLMVFQ